VKDMRKTLLRLWLIIWVITLPLVHIHPDADHAYGMPGHVHGGTYHTILIDTPVSAHQDHQHDSFSLGEAFGPSKSPSHPPHGFEEETYGLSLIKPSIDLESEKSEFPNDLVLTLNVEPLGLTGVSKPNFTPKKRRFSILPKTLSPRAPPILSI